MPTEEWKKLSETNKKRVLDHIAAHPEEFKGIVQRALIEPAVPAETDWEDACYYQQCFEQSLEAQAKFENTSSDYDGDASAEDSAPAQPQTKAEKNRRKRKLKRYHKGQMLQDFALVRLGNLGCRLLFPKFSIVASHSHSFL